MKKIILVTMLFLSGCSYLENIYNPDTPLYRMALIISNETYEPSNSNIETIKGAEELASKLKNIGFDRVLPVQKNLSYEGLIKAFELLESQIVDRKHTMLFIYFAGHGVLIDGKKDAYIELIDKKKRVFLNINFFNEQVEKLNIEATVVSIDACRDLNTSSGVKIEVTRNNLADKIYFNYSTRDRETAPATSKGRVMTHYTELLLKYLNQTIRVDDLYSKLKEELVIVTDGRQVVKFEGTLNPSFYFERVRKSGLSSYN